MKTTFLKIAVATLALASVPAFNHHASASSISIDDWYGINNVTPLPNPAPVISSGNTVTPNYQNIGANNIWVFSYFDSINVLSGQKIILEFDLTLSLAEAAQNFGTMSFGLFNSSTPQATTGTWGTRRITTTSGAGNFVKGWEGILVQKRGTNPVSHPFEVSRKTGGASYTFVATNDADITYALSGTAGYSMSFTNDVARSFKLTLERIGDDLIFSGSVGNGMNFVQTTITNGFSGGLNTFDAFGFYASGGGAGQMINSAQFTNVSLQLVPEPSITALLLVTLAALGIRRRRRV